MSRYQIARNNRRKIAIGAGLLALLLVCGIAGFRIFSGKDKGAKNPINPATGITYDQNAEEGGWSALSEEEIAAALNSKVEEGMINISMNTSPIFPDGKSEGNLMIVNELVNTYPQRVELIRNDTDEVIYSSSHFFHSPFFSILPHPPFLCYLHTLFYTPGMAEHLLLFIHPVRTQGLLYTLVQFLHHWAAQTSVLR